MRSSILRAGLFLGLFTAVAATEVQAAEGQDPVRVYGAIQSVEGATITARNEDGSMVRFSATGRIVSNQPIGLEFLRPGLSVALDTTMREGKMVVTHVHTQGWERAPGTFATRPLNSDPSVTRHLGRIAAVEPLADGVRMRVIHEGGQSDVTVDVPDAVPILYHNREETANALRPGMLVMATANRGDGGQLTSGFVTVEAGTAKPIPIPD